MGGALTAVTPDFTRASLGVPAMNYSVLLPRSVDFDPFAGVLYPSYPDELSRPLALDLIQMLWDRGDPNGYAHRMTDRPAAGHAGPPGADERRLRRPPGDRLPGRRRGADGRRPRPPAGPLRRAAGRTPTSSGTCRRSAATRTPARRPTTGTPGRSAKNRPGPTVGTDPPPYENLPNRSGADPHGAPRATPAEQQLVSDFFEGAIPESDNCGGGPCFAIGFSGP